ncbi:efflux RND transporter permease subunit [Alteromonas ponticola]|uniref:Efflux RND transporter permease subunit n=1 Tax=Alteromonas aquimaris TaxID=2998417 RepID=A0ABT3PAF7_9ALTE|nr:efflux RND transporter permease subunit [Alteromonas aquimaris]MCW8109764.1 efflux RND transporter permease subunit [Alteromonas aquimaris]
MNHPPQPWYSLFYQRPHLLVLSLVILLVAGISALTNMPRLEDPRIDTRNTLVITPYPGASAEQVEALISDVLEDKLREIYEIKEIESTSRAGISIIKVELQDWVNNTNNEQIFSEIRDSLHTASTRFPPGAGKPIFDEKRGATAFTLLLAVEAAHQSSSLAMTARLANEMADRLRNVNGTEIVRVYGAAEEEIVVDVDPLKLAPTGLTLAQISQQIQRADSKLPAGIVQTEESIYRLKVAQPLANLDVVKDIVLHNRDGRYLRLADIASISRGFKTPISDMAFFKGKRTVFVAARMQTTLRSGVWTEQALKAVDGFNHDFAGSFSAEVAFEQNQYTSVRLVNLTGNLLLGCIVVVLVIFLFMGYRAAWIVSLALPLTAAFTLFALSLFNVQIHQMSIFGMIIAIGLLIDNAIVITDEIRINLRDTSLTRLQAMTKSVSHLFTPLLASTLTTILGFMPIFLLSGNIGDFISSIAISVVMALIGSLFISLTLIAALAARYLPRHATQSHWWLTGWDAPVMSATFNRYLGSWIKHPLPVISVIVVLCLSGFALTKRLDNVFFPSADRNQFEVYMWTPEGTSIEQTAARAMAIDSVLQRKSDINQVTWLVGGSAPSVYYNQVMTRDNTPHFANAVVTTGSAEQASRLISQLQYELEQHFADLQIIVRAFGQGPPIAAPIEVDIIGQDIAKLDELGKEVRLLMSRVDGITQSIASIGYGEPELTLQTSESVTSSAGLGLSDIAVQLQHQLTGVTGGSVLEGTEEIPIRVKIESLETNSISKVMGLPLANALDNTAWLTLASLSDVSLLPSLNGITRKQGERINKIQAFLLPDVPAIDVSNQLKAMIDKHVTLPPGYRIQMAGDADEQQQAMGQLGTYAPVLLVLMLTTLILSFNSVRKAMLIGVVAVLSVGLGMLSLWLSGLPLGFNPLLGSAGLIGVAINGSIVVIAAINSNARARAGDTRAIVQETMGCSRHILSTTFTTVGGLIPLLLFSNGTFWPPLAVVLAGGVGFSVILSLVFTPTVLGVINRRSQKSLHPEPA